MAKKQKKATPERTPTRHQLSKWQRQMKTRRIVIIAAVVFLVGISSWVGYGYYRDTIEPFREVVITVNDTSFSMSYFLKMLDISVRDYIYRYVSYYRDDYAWTNNITVEEAAYRLTSMVVSDLSKNTNNTADLLTISVADGIIGKELLRQGAKNLGLQVTAKEIGAWIEANEWSDDRIGRDMASANLSQEKLEAHFGSSIPDTMEQSHVQVIFVESNEVADEVMAEVEAGGNFTALARRYSYNSSVEGDLGWLPEELVPNTLIANAAFNLTPGETIHSVYDGAAIKQVGYWLIQVTDRQDDNINALVMLLGSRAEAERVKAQLAAGANFSALAGNYSQHESRTKGGKLDGLKRGDVGSAAFDRIAFDIAVNTVSEPVKDASVQTASGYWLIRVLDRDERELDERVKKELIYKRLDDWFQEWKRNSTTENLLDAAKRRWAMSQVLV